VGTSGEKRAGQEPFRNSRREGGLENHFREKKCGLGNKREKRLSKATRVIRWCVSRNSHPSGDSLAPAINLPGVTHIVDWGALKKRAVSYGDREKNGQDRVNQKQVRM